VRSDPFGRAKKLLLEVADLPEHEREAYLNSVCKEDPELRREVDSLLLYDEDRVGILKKGGAVPTATGDSFIGQTVAHYRILDKLGAGGMGVVYKAEDTQLKRAVALKFLPPELTRDDEAKARFLREAQAAAALDHPNICTVYEIGESGDQTYIAMSYVEGLRLKDMIEAGPLQLEQAINLSIQIAEGLKAAHDKGIIHRDIKPGNIMVTGKGQARITDFGLAKLAGGSEITSSGTLMGTVSYMSPEQARGDPVDHRTDIWSFGTVIYEMVTAKRPFRGDHDSAIIYSILHEEPEPMTRVRQGVPVEIERTVNKAVAKELDSRYQSADEILAELRAVRNGSADLATVFPGEPSTPPPGASIASARKRFVSEITTALKRPRIMMLLAIIVVLGIGSFLLLTRRSGLGVDPRRVVVADFENQSDDKSLDYLGPLISDWMTQGLAQVGVVEVVPRMAASHSIRMVQFKAAGATGMQLLRALADHTKAGTVVSGAYRIAGEGIYFQAEIVDARRKNIMNSFSAIGEDRSAPMEAVEMLLQRVMGALAARFDPLASLPSGTTPPLFEAYREYIVGVGLFGTDFPKATEHFARASDLDSTFVHPRFWLIAAHWWLGNWAKADSIAGFVDKHRERLSTYDRCLLDSFRAGLMGQWGEQHRYLRQAERVSHTVSPTLRYLIAVNARNLNRPREAIQEFSQMKGALELLVDARDIRTPTLLGEYAKAHHSLGNYEKELELARMGRKYFPEIVQCSGDAIRALAALGRIEEVRKLINETVAISSQRWDRVAWTPGWVMIHAAEELRAHGHEEVAQEIAQKAVEWYKNAPIDQTSGRGYRENLAHALYQAFRWEEAREVMEALAREEPENIHYKGDLGTLAARRGERVEAERISLELKGIDRPYLFGWHIYYRARIASLLGDKDEAVVLLREAFAQGHEYGLHLHAEVDFQSLWDFPPFEELIRPKG
jgi:serine/threonine protein kinase/tetratricopeptide (TPR) repeat protein